MAPPRAALTVRAVQWATDALSYDDTTVSALARHLGVAWHTAWTAIEAEAKARIAQPERLARVKMLGVDEHIWRPSRIGADRAVTIMVDLTRDQDGCLHARLLDAVVGRSGAAYKAWLQAQPDGFTAAVEQAALDPFRGYANAIRDELPDAVAVLDAFHVVRLGTQATEAARMIRSTRFAGSCVTVSSTSPNASRANHTVFGGRRPGRRSQPGLAVLPAAALYPSRQRGPRPPDRRAGNRQFSLLSDPRNRPTRSHPRGLASASTQCGVVLADVKAKPFGLAFGQALTPAPGDTAQHRPEAAATRRSSPWIGRSTRGVGDSLVSGQVTEHLRAKRLLRQRRASGADAFDLLLLEVHPPRGAPQANLGDSNAVQGHIELPVPGAGHPDPSMAACSLGKCPRALTARR
jgi:hypothetical protein